MYPVIDNLAGMTQLGQGDAEGAATFFRHALSRDPDFAEAELNTRHRPRRARVKAEKRRAILDSFAKPPAAELLG